MTSNFLIVTFVDENDAPGIVASNWVVNNSTCYYPNVRTEEMKNKLLKRMADPDESTWPQYEIRILKSYETYGEARLHLKKAEDTSNLDSDEELQKRKKKKNSFYFPEDLSSSGFSKFHKPLKNCVQNRNTDIIYPTPPEVQRIELEIESADEIENLDDCSSNLSLVNVDRHPSQLLDACPVVHGSGKQSQSERTVSCQSGCLTYKQVAIQQSHLIQVVTDLTTQMAELNRKVDLLLGRSGEKIFNPEENISSDLLARLPVKDIQSFDCFNEQLKISNNRQAVIKFLAGIGGRCLRNYTTNILRRILLDEVAELYSLTGKQMKNSSKRSFLQTETFGLIFQICKNVYDDVTENVLRSIISDWLNQAKVRMSRRARNSTEEAD